MSEKYIINIFGAMTTGKSTLAERLSNIADRTYTVDYDVVKKQIKGFYSKRDRAVATKIGYDTLASVAATELPIVALLPPPTHEDYDRIVAMAHTGGRTILNIELVAPTETLVARYKERLAALEAAGTDTSLLRTVEEFRETIQADYFRPEGTHTFDSSELSPDEIFEKVRSLL